MSVAHGSTLIPLPQKPIFSIQEVTELLGVSRDTVEQELRAGRLLCKRMGRRRIAIPYAALASYLASTDSY